MIQFSSVTQLCLILCDPMDCSKSGFSVYHQSLLKPMPIQSVMPSNHHVLCCLLLLLPSIFPSIRVFSKESALRLSGQSIGVLALKAVLPMSIQG